MILAVMLLATTQGWPDAAAKKRIDDYVHCMFMTARRMEESDVTPERMKMILDGACPAEERVMTTYYLTKVGELDPSSRFLEEKKFIDGLIVDVRRKALSVYTERYEERHGQPVR